MGLTELTLVAIGLSMDAFAVSICKGLNMAKFQYKNCFLIALSFGTFQAVMPLLGWFFGTRFERYITSFDHWIAFGLLALIGGKMICDSRKEPDHCGNITAQLKFKEIIILALATSIDALAVGVTFALLPGINVFFSVTLIGLITFVLSVAGVAIGHRFGNRVEKKAELTGGIILVAIGLKILLEHLL
ncbi:MAG: manganese efflux pump MntP family protein [Oscillospiraceae bacterium]